MELLYEGKYDCVEMEKWLVWYEYYYSSVWLIEARRRQVSSGCVTCFMAGVGGIRSAGQARHGDDEGNKSRREATFIAGALFNPVRAQLGRQVQAVRMGTCLIT